MKHVMTAQAGCAGWYRLEKTKVDAAGQLIERTRHVVADWFPNLITDAGLDLMARDAWLFACHVGSGSAAPAVSDTRLQSRMASTYKTFDSQNATVIDRRYGFMRKTFRFDAGTVNGNVTELGIANKVEADQYTLFSRALVLDGNGQPTSITVLADEVLDVTYELRLYAPTSDGSGDATFANSKSVHHWSSRACDLSSTNTPWNVLLGSAFDVSTFSACWGGKARADNTLLEMKESVLGGAQYSAATKVERQAYTAGSHVLAFVMSWDLDQGNFDGGLGWVGLSGSFGAYQWAFTPKIPKTASQRLSLTMEIAWSRLDRVP